MCVVVSISVTTLKHPPDCFRSHPEHYSDEIADDEGDANSDNSDTQAKNIQDTADTQERI